MKDVHVKLYSVFLKSKMGLNLSSKIVKCYIRSMPCYGAEKMDTSEKRLEIDHHHLLLPPWIRSFDLFRHRRVAIVSWGVRDPFFSEVCT